MYLYDCKCQNKYCINHLSDHNCKYNYQKEHKKLISNNNIKITSIKMNKI